MSLDRLRVAIQPLRATLLNHPLYSRMRNSQALRTFMEHHVFAVWDFMTLLKVLQQRLSCVSVPWMPTTNATGGRLINEIVLGEESDEDGQGGYASHFELYHRAMTEFGASTAGIDRFLSALRGGESVREGMKSVELPVAVQQFVNHTFSVIESGDLCRISATFTFGREDLLPEVFGKIVEELNEQSNGALGTFKYYLLRHVEVDSNEHGPMAARLISSLCGSDGSKWEAAKDAAIAALDSRLMLWDGIDAAIKGARAASQLTVPTVCR